MSDPYALQLASAEVLVGKAAEMILDAAGLLKDAGDQDGHQELSTLNDLILEDLERLRRKRILAEAANDQ